MATRTERLHEDQRDDVRALVAAVTTTEERPPLSENKAMRLEGALDSREVVVIDDDGSLVGYGQAAWHRGEGDGPGHWALEVVVAPQSRVDSIVARLIEDLRVDVGDDESTLWSRSNYVSETATTHGWLRQRVLWEMHVNLPIAPADAVDLGFRFEAFRVGTDEGAWLEANNATFAGHPENGQMTRRDLEIRMAQHWFDSAGFVLAWHGAQLAGSCWTKVHDNGVGEIYIVGVVPKWEGHGLGEALVRLGLDHLTDVKNTKNAMLFVESSNERAIDLYQRLGFRMVRTVEAYSYPRLPPAVLPPKRGD
ncbi:MAG: mycothiol synthase [Actinomycetota bacterium]|nr:mycothiol synthase [Actinomycetota bacterium]